MSYPVQTPLRLSPVHDQLQSLKGTWREINGMPVVAEVLEVAKKLPVAIADLSYLRRFGIKGSGAIAWLAQQGFPIPAQPNSWNALPNGDIIVRLGMSEFLIEAGVDPPPPPITTGELESQSPPVPLSKGDAAGRGIKDLGGNSSDPPPPPFTRGELESQDLPPQVYPVLRQDLAIALYGTSAHELLRQTCSFNFRALSLSDRPVVLTSMIGVSVTVIPGDRNSIPFYRIWCDGTFGAYFWETLLAIAQELGGGAIGIEQVERMKDEG
ncbi:MAG: hypothetical protein SFY66_27925 [Oculatellaceae cyanobacterium bins.114]|nr:hypothetical protein [Oculatellaceae cyanobacterium bins.114]